MKASVIGFTALTAASCMLALPALAQSAENAAAHYVAELTPMNTEVTGLKTAGKADFAIADGQLTITVKAENAPAGIMHLQHFHGFTTDAMAHCPSADADSNGDGIIDLIETEPAAGTTMLPFTADPASMEIVTDSYPTAAEDGSYSYQQVVPMDTLQQAFADAFDGQDLTLDHRVVFIHGVSPDADLPDSVASLGDIPAHVTLPIACGEITAVN